MATIERDSNRGRIAGWYIAGFGVFVACIIVWAVVTRPAQMGADDEAFATVDALFTAITANRADLLESAANRLSELATAGRLPQSAWSDLQAVIDQARSGAWEPAGKRLYAFMQAQKREGFSPEKKRKGVAVRPKS